MTSNFKDASEISCVANADSGRLADALHSHAGKIHTKQAPRNVSQLMHGSRALNVRFIRLKERRRFGCRRADERAAAFRAVVGSAGQRLGTTRAYLRDRRHASRVVAGARERQVDGVGVMPGGGGGGDPLQSGAVVAERRGRECSDVWRRLRRGGRQVRI